MKGADSHLTDLFVRRPILSLVTSLLILLVGISALFSLPIRQYPDLESATIVVTTSLPGATQEVMQGFVTTPIAQAIATARGIEYLTSSSTQGHSEVKAKLVLNANADRAMTEILAKTQEVKYRLPDGATDPVIYKITDGAADVQYIAFRSDTLSMAQVADFVIRVAQPLLTSIPGVAAIGTSGAEPLAMRIWIDPVRMAARGLTAGDISAALRANNSQVAPGQLKGTNSLTNITATTDLRSVEAFRKMVVKTGADGIVRLGDVATVALGAQNYNTTALSRGKRAVIIALRPSPDGNPLDIVAAAQKLIPQIQAAAPPGITVVNTFDVAHFVNASIAEVERALVEAIAIVVLVVFLLLGSFRAVIIPVVTIPLSLVGTAALMLLFGFSLNLLTLLAMVLAIGLVVDDAIVVVENIHRHIEEGLSPFEAAMVGAREIVGPVIAMTITLAAVYAPIGFMGGLTGALFREFAFTLAGSVIVSGVVALTLSPMMSSLLLDAKVTEGRFTKAVERRISNLATGYRRLLAWTLSVRPAVLLVAAAMLVAVVVLFLGSERELAPQEDQGYVLVSIKGPQYANIDYIARYSAQIERTFHAMPEYDGSFFVNGFGGQNMAFGGSVFTDWEKRTRSALELQGVIYGAAQSVLGASVTPFQPPSLPSSSSGLPFQMVLRSTGDFHRLYEDMEALKATARKSGLFAYVDSDLAFDSPEARIEVDQSKAGEVGVTMAAIADTLAVLVGENYVNRFNFHDRSYDVIPQVLQKDRLTPRDLGNYYVRSKSGELVPLSSITKVDMRPAPNGLTQFNQMNAATLSAVVMPGVTMGQAVAFMNAQPQPAGTGIDWLADSRQYVHEGNRLTLTFGFAIIVIFLVLAAQFESLRDPIVILVTVPLAICGALLPLYLGFATVNIYTQIGLVTLVGLISKHGILIVAFANELQRTANLDREQAVLQAAMVRMRPILMTTAAMVAGLVPLLFAAGAGAESRFSIGIVVVMGMLVGTLFTLFVLPTIYTFVAGDHRPRHEGLLARHA